MDETNPESDTVAPIISEQIVQSYANDALEVLLITPEPVLEIIDTDHLGLTETVEVLDRFAETTKALTDLEENLGRRLDALQNAFDREIRAEVTREKVVDRLHAELQEYKQDLLLNVLRPVFVDLIQLHDDIGKIVAANHDEAETTAPRLLGFMAGFQQAIEDILYRQGVEPFSVDDEAFDPRRQRALSTVPSTDPAQARTVAQRHRKGFRSAERIIRPELVSVYSSGPKT